jgi:fibronectin type 3 domain-containing protein
MATTHFVTLSWAASTDPVQGYNIYRSTTQGAETTATTPINSALVTGTTYTDNTVTVGNQYYYEVRSVAGSVQSVVSNEVASAVVVPFPPTNLVISAAA